MEAFEVASHIGFELVPRSFAYRGGTFLLVETKLITTMKRRSLEKAPEDVDALCPCMFEFIKDLL